MLTAHYYAEQGTVVISGKASYRLTKFRADDCSVWDLPPLETWEVVNDAGDREFCFEVNKVTSATEGVY